MLRSVRAELLKTRRRFDWLLLALLAGTALLLGAGGAPDSLQELASGYSAFFYTLPIVHVLVMPVGMAALTTRLWDAETRGNTRKLLFTLQSRGDFYAAKTLLGLFYLLALAGMEALGLLAIGRVYAFTEAPDPGRLLWLLVCGAAVEAVLLAAFTLLQLRFGSPVLLLGVGLGCSMGGFFLAMLADIGSMGAAVLYAAPFAWFLPLSDMEMAWDAAARQAVYLPQPRRYALLAAALGVGALLFLWGRRAAADREV